MSKKIQSLIRKACHMFGLINNDDHIAVSLSGGKDSLALLLNLHAIQGYDFKFKLSAVHVTGSQTCGAGVSVQHLKKICDDLNIDLHILEQKGIHTSCYPCSYERRSLIFRFSKSHGMNKVAFGHHADDTIETLLMNLLHKGKLNAMHPSLYMKHYGIVIIRPLIFVRERMIIQYVKEKSLLRVMCKCPIGAQSLRFQTKQLMNELVRTFPNSESNLLHVALQHYALDYND